ncbi:bifunctional oligoribonuclease/PAP phosphatase NrnA [Candidatus Bipolaricaulota bacterium]|nr:bifunctional oligoribonuclease/PAP phosphatase NrnA [Candidatus Bipolaricaulota bacterium]
MNRLKEIENEISRHKKFLIASHRSPEADAIGSQLGLGRALRLRGKQTILYNRDGVPKNLSFLKGSDSVLNYDELPREVTDVELGIVLDCSNLERLGDKGKRLFGGLPTINIDHHKDNTNFGYINYVKPVAATTQIIADLIDYMGLEPDEPIATALYAGIIADTSSFQNENVSANLMAKAADLLESGANARSVIVNLYEREPFSKLKLLGEVLSTAKFEDGIVWAEITPEKIRRAGATQEDTEGVVGKLRTTEGAEVACLFKKLPEDTIKVSLRSKDGVDVCNVARNFGGGGHKVAAGCMVDGRMEEVEEKLLKEIKKEMDKLPGSANQG